MLVDQPGRLLIDAFGRIAQGRSALIDLGDGVFRTGDETSPHRMTLDWLADGKTLRCRASDSDFYRVE